MGKLILLVLNIILSSAFSRILTGAGLSLFSYTFMTGVVTNLIASYVSAFPIIGIGFNFLSISGIVQGSNIVLSALVTRATIKSLTIRLGKS
jgi:Protein of unknown function (DUF2523)